jgi:low temperature requirement protein LtrA
VTTAAALNEPKRVTTLELFFDLVFVFTLTQLTAVLFEAPNGRGLLRVVEMLAVIWWMYAGYAWMTNAVDANTVARRVVLFAAMGAYFVLALSIPKAFDGAGLAFGVAYLLVVVMHTALFTRATVASAVEAILGLARYNLVAAFAVLAGGAVGGTAQYVLWGAAGAFEWLTPLIRGTSGFLVGPAHFVERHGLVVMIAIGESVVAIGFGASQLPVDGSLVAVAVVGLALSACLWWLYFGGDDERAEQALGAMPQLERAFAAVRAFGYWHMPMLMGIIAIAAVQREATAHPFSSLSWARAAILGAGVAAYLAGDVAFRRVLGIGRIGWRSAGALLSLAVIPVGVAVSPFAETAVLVALLIAVIVAEATRAAGSPATTTFGGETWQQ